ncbi:MAG: alkyl hydroperoxide reductase [Planctomycetota bacterium]
MTWTLRLAGVYNLLWGAAVVAAPTWGFELAGLAPPRYPSIWQCVGMVVGVYGVGYLAAAPAPLRHWPIVLVGLLGKVLGPIGFLLTAARGELPWGFGWTIVTNDLVWWVPFALILHAAWRAGRAERKDRRRRPAADAR